MDKTHIDWLILPKKSTEVKPKPLQITIHQISKEIWVNLHECYIFFVLIQVNKS